MLSLELRLSCGRPRLAPARAVSSSLGHASELEIGDVGRQPQRRPEQVEMRRAGSSATTRQGIKNTISPAEERTDPTVAAESRMD